jgi:hypothetical protein
MERSTYWTPYSFKIWEHCKKKINTEPDNLLKYFLDYTPSFTNAAILCGSERVWAFNLNYAMIWLTMWTIH